MKFRIKNFNIKIKFLNKKNIYFFNIIELINIFLIIPMTYFLKNSLDSKANALSGSPLTGLPIAGAFMLAKNILIGSFPYYSTIF